MNEDKIYSFLSIAKKAGKLVSGYNSCEFDIKKDKCKLIIIAEDASQNTIEKFKNICSSRNVPFAIFGSKERLGTSIGKDEASVLGIKDDGMSRVVLNMMV